MFRDRAAKFIRIISIPPIVVSALAWSLYTGTDNVFGSTLEAFLLILFLGIVPALAYPCQMLVPKWKSGGRAAQRKLAFVFSFAGYTAALIWSFASGKSTPLRTITMSYFLSVVILIIFNKLLKIRSSGHSCSATAPIALIFLYVGWVNALPWLAFLAAVVWSSLYLKRHTAGQLFFGSVTCLLSVCLSLLLL